MSEMENWALAMGAPAVPHVSQAFLDKIIGKPRERGRNGGRGAGSMDGRRRGFERGNRPSRYSDMEEDGYEGSRSRPSRYAEMEEEGHRGRYDSGILERSRRSEAPWAGRGRQSGRKQARWA